MHGLSATAILATGTLISGITLLPGLLGADPPTPPCPIATGEFDAQAGASNQITTCKVLEALSLVDEGRIVPLGRVYEAGMPLFGDREYNFEQKMPDPVPVGEENDPRPTGGPFGPNGTIFNDGIMFRTEIDQVGTQFDGPGHIGRIQDGDPRKGKYFLGLQVKKVNATPAEPEGGLRELGVEHVKPLVTRGILVDVAPDGTSDCAGQPCWDRGEEISLDDVAAALEDQGMSLDDITSGDAVFFNTGWGHLWMVENERFNDGMPGIGFEVGEWLVERGVVLVGADNWAVEVTPNPENADLGFPLHQLFITDNGIFLHEILVFDELISAGVYEFVYVFVPVQFKGATGSPGNPIAVY
jgi:kynurenine formamidase